MSALSFCHVAPTTVSARYDYHGSSNLRRGDLWAILCEKDAAVATTICRNCRQHRQNGAISRLSVIT